MEADKERKGKTRSYEVVGVLWHLHVTFLINFYFLSFPNIPFSSLVPQSFFFSLSPVVSLFVSWAPASEPSQSITKEGNMPTTGGRCKIKESFVVWQFLWSWEEEMVESLWNFSLSWCFNFLLYTLPKSFPKQPGHLRRIKDIWIKWVDSIIFYIALQVVNSLMFTFCPIHSPSYSSLHLIKPKPLPAFSRSGPFYWYLDQHHFLHLFHLYLVPLFIRTLPALATAFMISHC